MAWEQDKSTATDPDNPSADEQLTADEWNAHVSEGHFDPSNFQLGSDANGNPVLRDPQNNDQIVATYDRANGQWDFPAVSTENATIAEYIDGFLDGIAIGDGASADADGIAIGENVSFSGQGSSVVVGYNAVAPGTDSVAIGPEAGGGLANQGISIGRSASVTGYDGIAIGNDADAASRAVALTTEGATVKGSIAIGEVASATADSAVSIGRYASIATANAGRIGVDQLVFGGTRDTVADADLSNGELTVEMDETNGAFRLRGKDSTGTIREATVPW